MKLRYFVIIGFVFYASCGYSQSIDSLLFEAREYHFENEFSSSIEYARKAEVLAEKRNAYDQLIQSIKLQIIGYESMDVLSEMIPLSNKLVTLSQNNNDKKEEANGYNYLGNAYSSLYSNSDKAFEYYSKALEIGEELNSSQIIIVTKDNLAILYSNNGEFLRARAMNKENLELMLNNNPDPIDLAISYSNIGTTYQEDDVEMSLFWYQKADSVVNQDSTITLNYTMAFRVNIALAYLELGRISEAKDIFTGLLPRAIEIGQRGVEIHCYYGIAQGYYEEKDFSNYLKTLNIYYDKSVEYQIIEGRIQSLEMLQDYYSENELFQNAYEYSLDLKEIKDSLNRETIVGVTEKFEMMIELEDANQELELLEKEKTVDKLLKSIYIIVILSIIGFGTFLFISLRKTIAKNKKIAKAKSDLDLEKIKSQNQEIILNKEKLKATLNLLIAKNKIAADIRSNKASDKGKEKDLSKVLSSKILTKEDWSEFKVRYEVLFPNFSFHLRNQFPHITDAEQRLFMLIKLNLNTNDIADVLGISVGSVRKTRLRLRKALDIETSEKLEKFIFSFE